MAEKISVIGAGSWGTAIAKLLAENGHDVKLWVRNTDKAKYISENRCNKYYLPNVLLPENIEVISDLQPALPADLIIFAPPSHALRGIASAIATQIPNGQMILSCTKGLESGSFLRMSDVLLSECPAAKVAVMSGPNHAIEVANRENTATVIACEDITVANTIAEMFVCDYFRPYTNVDIKGVEFGGAFKNIIAIALGMLEGLDYKDNIKAATMTRGLAEITRISVAMGANPQTFLGLSGMGDLISTCTSTHSRNRNAGIKLAKGNNISEIIASTDMVIEGVKTIQTTYELSNRLNIEMPITKELYQVIYSGKDVKSAIADLMLRDYKSEFK